VGSEGEVGDDVEALGDADLPDSGVGDGRSDGSNVTGVYGEGPA
jgi:hypothetical protein